MNFLIRNQFSMCCIIYCSLEQIIKNELVSHIAKKKRKRSRTCHPRQDWSWVTNSHFPPVSWISHKTISMTCRRSTVGRVRTARQGLRIAAGSEWDEHTIRGKATRAYLPFHDGCHHLRVLSAAPPPRWESFLAEPESFLFSASGKVLEETCGAPQRNTWKSLGKGVKQKWEVRRCQPGWE